MDLIRVSWPFLKNSASWISPLTFPCCTDDHVCGRCLMQFHPFTPDASCVFCFFWIKITNFKKIIHSDLQVCFITQTQVSPLMLKQRPPMIKKTQWRTVPRFCYVTRNACFWLAARRRSHDHSSHCPACTDTVVTVMIRLLLCFSWV